MQGFKCGVCCGKSRDLGVVKGAVAPHQAGPIGDSERADVLDALRGFALLGIFISHIPDFSGLEFLPQVTQVALDRFGIDQPAALLQDFLIRGKFYSLFSLLFGIGFSIQMDSAGRHGIKFAPHFARRGVCSR